MLLGDEVNLLLNWLLKLYILSPTLSAPEKNLYKNLFSSRVTVECVFGMLTLRWKGLLTILVANRENVANPIITGFVLYNFYYRQINGEAYLEDNILYVIMNQERANHQGRHHNSNDVLQDGETRATARNCINKMQISGKSHIR